MAEQTGPQEKAGPPTEEQAMPQKDELSLMRERLDEALREKDQFRLLAQRAQADLQNFKRRAAEEQEEARRKANTQLILKVLSIMDDLHLALSMAPDSASTQGWLEGLRLVERNLQAALEFEGVTRIQAQGQPFMPWEHEAVQFEETRDVEEGRVVRVLREGYRLNNKVIRAAQVAVARAPQHQDRQPESTQ